MFRVLKLIYFPTITKEETYVAGWRGEGCSEIVFLAGFRKSAQAYVIFQIGNNYVSFDNQNFEMAQITTGVARGIINKIWNGITMSFTGHWS